MRYSYRYLLIVMLFLSCKNQDNTNIAVPKTSSPNPYGALIADPVNGSFSISQKTNITNDSLKCAYARLLIVLQNFSVSSPAYDSFKSAGLKTALNLNWGNPGSSSGPVAFPTDISSYSNKLDAVLIKYQPDLAVIENEESNQQYHSGAITDYFQELKTAVDHCHAKGIKVTNGGIVERIATLLVWNDYYTSSQFVAAKDYASRAFPKQLLDADGNPNVKFSAKLAAALSTGLQLIAAYKMLDIDFVNFHWYEPVAQRETAYQTADLPLINTIDTKTLEETISYLHRATGKTVVTNEIGQLNLQPGIVLALLQKLTALKIPIVVWYSGDGGTGQAVALQNADGTLRANGLAFASFIKANY